MRPFLCSKFALALLILLSLDCGVHAQVASKQVPAGDAQSLPPLEKSPIRMSVSRSVLQKMLVSKTEPQYPAEAAARNVEGPVVVSIVVDQNGEVTDAKHRCGAGWLTPAALDAVKMWKYKPAIYQGKRVEVTGDVIVEVNAPTPRSNQSQLRLDPETAEANLLSAGSLAYPPAAAAGRIQGCVIVHCVISEEGKVQSTKTVSGHPLLASSAEIAANQNRYKPFTKDGAPVVVETYVVETFKLP
jgi:TonB family protein